MKISIITVCFNSQKTIADTIKSINSQTYKNIEHVIIDGGSTDDTMAIIDTHKTESAVVVSSADKGIYDAMNKGIALASGDIIGTLNSDDIYADTDVLARVAAGFDTEDVDASYGDLVYVEQDNTDAIVRYWKSGEYRPELCRKWWYPAHPTFFVRKRCYDKYGLFDLDFVMAADVELMLRFICRQHINIKYIPQVLVRMRIGGESNKSLKNIFVQNLWLFRAYKKNNIKCSLWRFWGKNLNRIIQFLKRPAKAS